MRRAIVLSFFLFCSCYSLYSQNIHALQSGHKTSIRGLSVVDNSVAWVSGSNGWTSLTSDAGKNWTWKQVPGYEKLDFRDIEAFSEKNAIIVSAGSPAVVLRTTDSGVTWKEVYRNDSPEMFLDGMDFWDSKTGMIYGDPIKGKMQLLKTSDSGLTWQNINDNLNVNLIEGEASFAASGTAIRCLKKGSVYIVTGGIQSRIFVSKNFGNTWDVYPCPIIQGKSSTGPFSIAFLDSKKGIAAGGDYQRDTLSENILLLTKNGGKSWVQPVIGTDGYKSAIEYITSQKVIATGTSGTDISEDGGRTWNKISDEGYNSVRKAKSGSWVLLAGGNGKISELRTD
ncbi:MAG: oxidoreductase [Daejeonella sp.]